jgi:crotonobetainyl-CoA:carnitine CoA-transferase CaiB-like acyl-CoA transferase
MADAKGPLHGVRVVDLTTVVAGPMATSALADMGADVIKVEDLKKGDSYRDAGTVKIFRDGDHKEALGGTFYTVNRGKRSIGVDLKSKTGQMILHKLIATADVFTVNMRPAAAERLGLAYEQLKKSNPNLIYLAQTGWGVSGPLALKKAYDPLVQAAAGVIMSQARPTRQGGGDKYLANTIVIDKTTAMTSAQAILAALYARTQGRGGQKIDLSMIDSGLAFNWSDVFADQCFLDHDENYKQAQGIVPEMFGTAETKDGKTMVFYAVELEPFCKAFNRPDLMKHRGMFISSRTEMEKELNKHTFEDVMKKFDEFDLAGGLVPLTEKDTINQPQVKHNDNIAVIKDPRFGTVQQAKPGARFSGTPAKINGPPPLRWEHTVPVLKSLGFSADEIKQFQKEGTVASTGAAAFSKL